MTFEQSSDNNKVMIYRLFRKQLGSRTPLQVNRGLEESLFIEELSRLIKVVKKRQDLYNRLLQIWGREKGGWLGPDSTDEELQGLVVEWEKTIEQSRSTQNTIMSFRGEAYFASKTYLYTTFMRVRQLLEGHRARHRSQGNMHAQHSYQQLKNALTDMYNDQTYQERYDLTQIMRFMLTSQTARVTPLLPKKKQLPSPLPIESKLLQRLREPVKNSPMRKTMSVELLKTREDAIDNAISRKLIVRELATEKRLQERKISKPKATTLFSLYKGAGLRPPLIKKTPLLKQELYSDMSERNRPIRDSLKQWEKQFLLFKYCRKGRK